MNGDLITARVTVCTKAPHKVQGRYCVKHDREKMYKSEPRLRDLRRFRRRRDGLIIFPAGNRDIISGPAVFFETTVPPKREFFLPVKLMEVYDASL